jgi:uncharacterized phage-associated protein
MRFVFNEKKAAQAAAYLLKLNRGKMKYLKLMKLLYLADRHCLIKSGLPITGDAFVAMKHGPVLSRTYDLLKSGGKHWMNLVCRPEVYWVDLVKSEPETDELCNIEIESLQTVFRQYGHLREWDLVNLTHSLPEYSDPADATPPSKVIPIDPEDILRAEEVPPQRIRDIAEQAQEFQVIHDLVLKAGVI